MRALVVVLGLVLGLLVASANDLDFELNNGNAFPALGLGIGNLAHRSIPGVVRAAVEDHGVRLIDTAMASANEHLLQETLRRLPGGLGRTVGIVTKVWYTHLGYGRTKIAVEESLKTLGRDASVTMLLHWPYCREDIEWMACEAEEKELDVRYLDRENAWKGSWRALEEFYKAGRVANIGVSNFDAAELAALLAECEVAPQVYQGNVWAALLDPRLRDLLAEHRVLFQAYNVMGGVVKGAERAPRAYRALKTLARTRRAPVSAIVLKALAQRDVAAIPRASSDAHLAANAPAAVAALADLDPLVLGTVERYARALLTGADVGDGRGDRGVVATFRNAAAKAATVFWENAETGERVPVTAPMGPGAVERLTTHPGHRFVVLDGDTQLANFTVTADRGGWQEFEL